MNKSKREQRLEKKRQEARRGQLRWVAIVVIVAIGLVGLLVFNQQVRSPNTDVTYTNKNGRVLGDSTAPVLVVEYGDFQCSHCRNFYATTEEQLISTFVDSGQVLFEYRPVDFLGPESSLSAQAALCAADQNFFWEYHDIVFSNYSTGNTGGYSEARLVDFASALDMDQAAFSACLSSGEMADDVAQLRSDAAIYGVTGTPSFLVNGQLLGGNVPFETLSTAINEAAGG